MASDDAWSSPSQGSKALSGHGHGLAGFPGAANEQLILCGTIGQQADEFQQMSCGDHVRTFCHVPGRAKHLSKASAMVKRCITCSWLESKILGVNWSNIVLWSPRAHCCCSLGRTARSKG